MKNEKIICPICSGISPYFFTHKDCLGGPVDLYKCFNCGHGSYDLVYSSKKLKEFYDAEYASAYRLESDNGFIKRKLQYQLDVELLLGHKKFHRESRVLDFGCSNGLYLDAMPKSWEKYGFEINPHHIEYLNQNKKNITVFKELKEIDKKFDIITFRGVIEHLSDFDEVIEFLPNHLIEGGLVYISSTPDFSSLCAVLYKDKWNQLAFPLHYHNFTTASISLLMAKAGLVLRQINHPYIGTPYSDWKSDKDIFRTNFSKFKDSASENIVGSHAFAGNMQSLIFEI